MAPIPRTRGAGRLTGMDGRGRLRREEPWGWRATTWQAWTFFLLAALMLSNAAWFYRSRVAAAEAPALHRPLPTAPENADTAYDWQAVEEATRRELERPAPLQPGERCINGQRFTTVDGVLQNVGTCQQ